jgi:hypothetical protein
MRGFVSKGHWTATRFQMYSLSGCHIWLPGHELNKHVPRPKRWPIECSAISNKYTSAVRPHFPVLPQDALEQSGLSVDVHPQIEGCTSPRHKRPDLLSVTAKACKAVISAPNLERSKFIKLLRFYDESAQMLTTISFG